MSEARLRKRIPKSCRRCHRRKQRCVGYPTCSNCESAQVSCTRSETVPSWHHAMSKGALAQRIEKLEAQLSALQGSSTSSPPPPPSSSSPPSLSLSSQSDQSGVVSHDSPDSGIAATVAWVTQGASAQSPSYLGPSSGRAVAANLGRVVDEVVWAKSIPLDRGQEAVVTTQKQQSRCENKYAIELDDEQGTRLIKAYFDLMHMRLPFLDQGEILRLHAERTATTNTDQDRTTTTATNTPTTTDTPGTRFAQFKLHMVYAIGAAILQMTQPATAARSLPPDAFRTAAQQFESCLQEPPSLATVEAMMLLALYHLRSSLTTSVWYLLGTAMRICVDFGLHRKAHYRQPASYAAAQHQARLFWSVYLIERYISWSLGRPFCIGESVIDADVPDDLQDGTQPGTHADADADTGTGTDANRSTGGLQKFIACIRLQRITSRIHNRIYSVENDDMAALLPEVAPMMAVLDEYEQSLPPNLPPADSEFIHMHWNNAIRVLLQPFVGILAPSDPLVRTCLEVSGRMCQSFKKLCQRDDASGYSFLVVNSIFMGGMTICFCLFRAPHLWTTTTANDLRACSSAIFIMAEQNARLKRCRDSLEAIINRTMDFVHEHTLTGHTHPSAQSQIQQPSLGADFGAGWLPFQETPFPDAFDVSLGAVFTEDFWSTSFNYA